MPFGTPIWFGFIVENVGDEPAYDVVLTDSVFNAGSTPPFDPTPPIPNPLPGHDTYVYEYGPVSFFSLFPCANSNFLVWGKGTYTTSAVMRNAVTIGANGSEVWGNVGAVGDVYVNGGGTNRIKGAMVTDSQFQQNPAQVAGDFIINNPAWPAVGLSGTYFKPTFVVPPAPPGGPNKSMANGYDWTTMPLANGIVTGGALVKLHFTGTPGGAVYFFDSLSLGNGGKLYFDLTNGPVKIYVKNQVSFGSGTTSILTGGDASMISLESLWSGTTSKPYGFNHAGGYWAGDVVCQKSGIHFGNGSTSGIFEGYMWSDWDGKWVNANGVASYSNAVYIEHGADVIQPPKHCEHHDFVFAIWADAAGQPLGPSPSDHVYAYWETPHP